MLSMQEVNQMLKENFQRQLQEITDLPEDLATGYKNWVRGLVKTAAQQISNEAVASHSSEEQNQEGAA